MKRAAQLRKDLRQAPGSAATAVRAAGRIPTTLALLLLLSVAGTLRFANLPQTGIRFDDEGWYVSDARLWHRCARILADTKIWSALLRRDTRSVSSRMAEEGVDFNHRYRKPCPGYTFLGGAMMFLVGDRPAALLVTNALLGTLTVAALHAAATLMFGRGVGLTAAFLLAVSPYHVIYSRSALADATTGFFIVLGVAFWAWSRTSPQRWRLAYLGCGAALGYAITCHYRSALVVVLLVPADLVLRARDAKRSPFPTQLAGSNPLLRHTTQAGLPRVRLGYLLAGLALPTALFEAAFQGARAIAVHADGHFPVATYLECLWAYVVILRDRVGVESGAVWNPCALAAYAEYLLYWQGAGVAVALVLGLGLTLRRPGIARWPALFVLVSVGALVFQRYTVARALSPALPFMFLCIAVALHAVSNRVTQPGGLRALVALAAAAVLAWPGLTRSRALLDSQSSLEGACRFLERHGPALAAVPMDSRKYALYLESSGIELVHVERQRVSDTPAEIVDQLRRAGVRWVVTDAQHWHCRRIAPPDHGVFAWWEAMEAELRHSAVLAAEFPHLLGWEREFLAEGWGLHFLDEMIERRGGAIRIYDLRPTRADARPVSPVIAGR